MARAYRFGGRVSLGGGRVQAGLTGKKAGGRTGKPGTGKKLVGAYRWEELVSPDVKGRWPGLTNSVEG